MIRRQLPAYSPLTARSLVGAALDAVASPGIARGRLAQSLASRFAADRVALTGSGTQALQLALARVPVSSDGSAPLVALPAYTCFDVATAAVAAQVRVVFYDVDPLFLTPDGDGCKLVFSETLDNPAQAARNAAGWELCLESMETILSAGTLAKFGWEVWRGKFRRYVKKFEPEFGPQEGPPEDHPATAEE